MLQSPDILLIDDNILHRSIWQKRLSGMPFHSFRNIAELESYTSSTQNRSHHLVFLDYELEDGTEAKENARRILALGYQNLFITTSHDPRAIEPISGISGIISKDPPSWLLDCPTVKLTSPEELKSQPTLQASEFNLRDILRFLPEEGKILVGSERMLLFRQGAFATLRNMIHDQVGPTLARSILTKFGFRNGQDDYHLLAKTFRWETEQDRLAAGPMMHAWSGIVHVEPTLMDFDRDKNFFHFKGIWRNSYEAEIHLATYGRSPIPVCSTLTGYGSGWCTAFFGSPVLEVETKCVACGDEHCEWEIKTVEHWGEEVRAAKEALMSSPESIYRLLECKSQDLNTLNQNLEQIVREKTEKNRYLVRVLCHDLQPPLEAIEEIVTSDLANPTNLARLQTAVASLRSSITEVRSSQVAEMESRHKEAEAQDRVTFEEIVKYLSSVFHYKLQQKNVSLVPTDSSQGKAIAGGRIVLLQQIFQNLISNAIKFSPRDSNIEVSASIAGREVVVQVSDKGIGIPKNQLEQIFVVDTQVSRTGTLGETGTGLGLSIVNHFAKKLGGKLSIQSTTIDESFENSGTTITIHFPLA